MSNAAYALLLCGILIVAQIIAQGNEWRVLLEREAPFVVTYREDFDGVIGGNIPDLKVDGDWSWGRDALMTKWSDSGGLGHVEFAMNVPSGARMVFVRLWSQTPGMSRLRIEAAAPAFPGADAADKSAIIFSQDSSGTMGGPGWLWRGDALAFRAPEKGGIVVIRLSYYFDEDLPREPAPVLQRLETGWETRDKHRPPSLPLMLAVAAAGYWGAIFWRGPRRDRPRWRDHIFPLLATAVLLWGAVLRWDWFIQQIGQPLSPDGLGFLQILQTMTGPFDTASTIPPWVREPFFPWIGWLWFRLTPDTATALRLLTVLLSLGAIGAAWEAGRRLVHPFAGFAAALLMAGNDYLIWSAPRGLREELFTILTLWLVMLLFALWRRAGDGGEADGASASCGTATCGVRWGCAWKWFAVAGALLVLTRVTSLAFIVPMLAALAAARRVSPRQAALTLTIITIPLLPHLMFNYHYSEERDPFFSANVHARYYRNAEFAGRPGFPSAEEARANPYGGGPITSAGYMFGLHSPAQWVALPVRGVLNIFATGFAYKISYSAHKPLLLLYALAFLLTFSQRRWWGLGAVLLVLAAPVAFVAGAVALDPRLLMPFMPFHFIILAIGLLRMKELAAKIRDINLSTPSTTQQSGHG